nr:hypothetical protein [Pleomorphomonas oryzae]
MMAIGAGVSAISSVGQGVAAKQAADANAKIQQQNAIRADQQAHNVMTAGMKEEAKQKAETTQLVSKQQAAMAANGVDPTFGSPLDLMVDTATLGAQDAAAIRASTYRNYDDTRNQAVSYRNQANAYKAQGSNALMSGIIGAGTSILTGATDIAKYKATMASKALVPAGG